MHKWVLPGSVAPMITANSDPPATRRGRGILVAERVWWADSARGGGHMNRFDQVTPWVIVAVFALAVGGGLGFWWLRDNVIAPSCGDVATAQLASAVEEMQSRIPGMRFGGIGDSCDSGGGVHAYWEHDDLARLLSEAAAAGCRVNEPDPAGAGEDQSLTCTTGGRNAILTFELGTVPLLGEMTLS